VTDATTRSATTPATWVLFAIALLLAVQSLALYLMGQPLICTCGYVKLWEGVVLGPGNSQHLTDWYTPSHVVHGVIYYAALTLIAPRASPATRFLLALGIEIAWEIFENTPFVIDRYREQALAQGYNGDSVINSIMDVLAMMVGFALASRLPVWATLAIVAVLELFVAYAIRDNLALNILNFLYPLDAVRAWQGGA
jgi:hypothetical protein